MSRWFGLLVKERLAIVVDYNGSKHGHSVQSRTAEGTLDRLPAHNQTADFKQTVLVPAAFTQLCTVSEMLNFTCTSVLHTIWSCIHLPIFTFCMHWSKPLSSIPTEQILLYTGDGLRVKKQCPRV